MPAIAGAQTARNPFADLFGRPSSQGGGERTSVQLRTTAGAQIGDTLRADFDRRDVVPDGLAAAADASVVAQYLRDRVQFVGQGRYSYQEFRQEPAFGAPAFDAGGRINFDLTSRIAFQGGGQFVRSPFFRLMWLAPEIFGPSVPAGGSAAILMMRNDSAEGNAGLTAQMGKRTSITGTAFTRQTRFAGAPQNDFTAVGGRGVVRRQLNRWLGLRAGYSREELRMPPATGLENYTNEIIDAGVDFAKSFSMGRRATFAFATETSMVRQNAGGRQFRLNGRAAFQRFFLRTWVTQLAALRGTEFLPGFRGPVFTERGNASIAGYMSRRLLLNLNGNAGRGAVGVGDARQFISYSGDASVTVGVTRHLGVFTQYVYYHYQMPPDPLALVTVPQLSRQAVSIGVKTWVSIIDKEKVPRDPR
ncbi:MAG: hypothetical protein K2Y23_22140 [Cyanobacteria bacterium]|nr:hypothetical protein [Cyanobacteriota bacterium]